MGLSEVVRVAEQVRSAALVWEFVKISCARAEPPAGALLEVM